MNIKMIRRALVICISVILSGCSIAAYVPVVGMSAAGYDGVSLKDDPEYAQIISATVKLVDTGEYRWTLRKFTNGRHFIERTYPGNKSTKEICSLNEKEIEITDIYEDQINGGTFYSAFATCNGDKIETTKNHWSNDMLHLFKSNITK